MADDFQFGQEQSAGPKLAKARYGAYTQNGPYVGMTVADLKVKCHGMWGVPNDSAAFIGKKQLADDYVIQEKDEIEFHRRQGEKGDKG